MDHLMDHPVDLVHGPNPWATPWTTPNFQQEIAPVNMKIYRRSGYEQKHGLVFIAYVLEGLSRNSGLAVLCGAVQLSLATVDSL